MMMMNLSRHMNNDMCIGAIIYLYHLTTNIQYLQLNSLLEGLSNLVCSRHIVRQGRHKFSDVGQLINTVAQHCSQLNGFNWTEHI